MDGSTSWQSIQDATHDDSFSYERLSPHLFQPSLHSLVSRRVKGEARRSLEKGGQCRVLDIGAGHGSFTDELVVTGAEVVASEMSSASVAYLADRYRYNSHVTVVHDPNGDGVLSGPSGFDLVTCISVLHHIPAYVAFLRKVVDATRLDGGLICFQDPLLYKRLRTVDRVVERAGYALWRLQQGNLKQGLQTLLRRVRGDLDESNPADMVEYHVVRAGVDEEAIARALDPWFARLEIVKYWSTYPRLLQKAGERLGLKSHFGVVASGRLAR